MSTPRRANGPVSPQQGRRVFYLALVAIGILILFSVSTCIYRGNTTAASPSSPSTNFSRPELSTITPGTPSPPAKGLPTPAFPAEFGDGFWLVGKQIAPVQYTNRDITNPDCFWARVDKATFPHPHIVQMSEHKAGSFKVVIHPTDQVFYTRNCGNWKHID